MDHEPPSSLPNSVTPPTRTNSRKERGAIAAQACESCRQRKQRCSEERPRCASCIRMKLDCKYREPQPTKKDKTLVEILERLKSLEGKVDNLSTAASLSKSSSDVRDSLPFGKSDSWNKASTNLSTAVLTSLTNSAHYEYISGVYKMFAWPFVQQLLNPSLFESSHVDLTSLQTDGLSILLSLQSRPTLLVAGSLATLSRSKSSSTLGSFVPNPSDGPYSSPSDLRWEDMHRLSKAYFDSFNLLYPIVDRHSFQTEILLPVASRGMDSGINSTLVCLVLALGEVAVAGVQGVSLVTYRGRPGGVKGGTSDSPPGLLLFNEARKRMGFNLTECSIENVQIFALAALYYGSCCLHTDFWRMTTSASLACQALLASQPVGSGSYRFDLLRRLFWHCVIMETFLNLEFNIPYTGLHNLEKLVGLPDFSGEAPTEDDDISNQASHFREHFASQIVLRRLSAEFHTTLTRVFDRRELSSASKVEDVSESAITIIKQLAEQLDHWRGLLPPFLRWEETSTRSFSGIDRNVHANILYPQSQHSSHITIAFTTNLDLPAVDYPFAADIQTAVLRTRYYYVKHLIHRPFVFKAIHHPEDTTQEDARGVAVCLQSSLLWPITLSPTRNKKRLVPCLVFWSQNLLGILLILHISEKVPILAQIRTDLLGEQFAVDAKETVRLYIDWIRDLKDVDMTAQWCWTILETLYDMDAWK